MIPVGKMIDRAARNRGVILWAITLRLCFYGCIALMAWCFAGFPLPRSREPAIRPPSDEAAPADPGWPHLRGANFDAKSANTITADSWPAEGPPVLWTREIGCGYSGVIAVANRVFTQTQSLTEQKVVALDADTGQTIWERPYGWPYDPGGMYPGPRSTPTWSNGQIYFAAPDGLVGCLSADDGSQLWAVNVINRFGGRGADFGYACSPLVEDGKVILPVGGPSAAVVARLSGVSLSDLLRPDSTAQPGPSLVFPAQLACRMAAGHPGGLAACTAAWRLE
jgi:hypothetical protein